MSQEPLLREFANIGVTAKAVGTNYRDTLSAGGGLFSRAVAREHRKHGTE